MTSKTGKTEREGPHIIIRGTGPKEMPPMPVGLLKPPGANPNGEAHESSGPASEEG